MNICFDCPACAWPARLDLPLPADWQCPGCDHLLRLPDAAAGPTLNPCTICGNTELYKKKDFPHWLGMSVLILASAGFLVMNAFRHQEIAWAILLGSAIFDSGLYLLVGDVVVCYRCDAHYRGFPGTEEQKPHELGIGERYRQERIRREQLEAERQK